MSGEIYETILLAAGSSTRLNGAKGKNKILLLLNDRPVFDYSLRLFLKDNRCKTVWLVVKNEEKRIVIQWLETLYQKVPEKIKWVIGGKERQDSVQHALDKTEDKKTAFIMVHDAARPFITQKMLDALVNELNDWDAVTLGLPAKDSMKLVKDEVVDRSLYRPHVFHIQTPQAFKKTVIKEAMTKAASEQFYGNEECELVERLGYSVKVIKGDDRNFKLTTAFDFKTAQFLTEEAKR